MTNPPNETTRRRSMWVLVLIPCVLFATSCAAVFRGPVQRIPFDSDPAGAEIYLDGEFVGVTPTAIELRRDGTYALVVRLGDREWEIVISGSVDADGRALLAVDAVPGGGLIALGLIGLAGCEGSFRDLCRDGGFVVVGTGVLTVGVPLAIDLATGAHYRLSPGDVFIDFGIPDASANEDPGSATGR